MALEVNISTWRCGGPPAKGQHQRYPGRFIYNLKTQYPEFMADDILHMFSGSCEWGVSTDIRSETGADLICPYDQIPLENNSFSAVLADPPYANHWANEWHADLPKPKRILAEASRLVREDGLIGILHIIVIPAYKTLPVERVGIHPVLCGPNNAVRAFNVFRKREGEE